MPRPRKDQAGPTAVERMEAAFWSSLAEKPFAKITISDIVNRASVNKNAFYYHYEGLHDLARQAIDHILFRDIAETLLGGNVIDRAQLPALANEPEFQRRLKLIRLVVGNHGNHELAAVLKTLILQAWLETFHLEASDLEHDDLVVVTFALGGLMELIGNEDNFPSDPLFFPTLLGIGLVENTSTAVIETLRKTAQRKHG